MKKKSKLLFLVALFFISLNNLFGQATTDNYCYIILKGEIVKNTISTYPDFAHFDFTYLQLEDESYTLSGYAKNENGDQLGELITLEALKSHPPHTLKNLEKGHLFLTLKTMQQNNVDGSEDYILNPKKCKDKDGNNVDYVSYLFSNKIDKSVTNLSTLAVTNFTLNPSPPYTIK